MRKAKGFLEQFLIILMIVTTAVALVYVLQYQFALFTGPFRFVQRGLAEVYRVSFFEIMTGVSIGGIFFALVMYFIPRLIRGVDNKRYEKEFRLGLISSSVFFVSEFIFRRASIIGRLYLVIAILVAGVLGFAIIELLSLLHRRKKDEVEFRSEMAAGISSGLMFAMLINFIQAIGSAFSGLLE